MKYSLDANVFFWPHRFKFIRVFQFSLGGFPEEYAFVIPLVFKAFQSFAWNSLLYANRNYANVGYNIVPYTLILSVRPKVR